MSSSKKTIKPFLTWWHCLLTSNDNMYLKELDEWQPVPHHDYRQHQHWGRALAGLWHKSPLQWCTFFLKPAYFSTWKMWNFVLFLREITHFWHTFYRPKQYDGVSKLTNMRNGLWPSGLDGIEGPKYSSFLVCLNLTYQIRKTWQTDAHHYMHITSILLAKHC